MKKPLFCQRGFFGFSEVFIGHALHDLRRSYVTRGGELEQIQFLLGHASVQTTECYLGCKQNLGHPVNDREIPRIAKAIQMTANTATVQPNREPIPVSLFEYCLAASQLLLTHYKRASL
jgi:hypothetical protein